MSRAIVSHVQTDIGRKRDNNEDNFVWLSELWSKPSIALVGAIDGVGGYEGVKKHRQWPKAPLKTICRTLVLELRCNY
ncbi:hypothetical protein [Niabella hibiscisoli]|uniref:hypothetical protein n=1 Tax=Niabella hibiscisoli TaxID=1825928 RepID=UPI001F0D8E05|nr:hypothetical protein [Niabella hibiscisoli]MCH5719144.1 hypothetical protein [Niabella hibiscisoli]